eukprot:CAMPEP_0170541334 /NCGR_PEP_ID=MMETSP0211-20121228/1091_1 /TAXON_ID=311385 /ORGANISM="Pseudokeronopsis sp., Strain OXSARD2" /LENGTH=86 /DNA_ID=CAMNT_0010844015 /DNA_START=2717 /DNA_END=2974 /DNA_ORIENTATION=+
MEEAVPYIQAKSQAEILQQIAHNQVKTRSNQGQWNTSKTSQANNFGSMRNSEVFALERSMFQYDKPFQNTQSKDQQRKQMPYFSSN